MPGQKKRRPKPPILLPIIIFPGIFQTLNAPLLQVYHPDTDQKGAGEYPEQDTDKTERNLFFHKSTIK